MLWLKSCIVRGASHHPAFMGNCPIISHTFSVFFNQWVNLLRWNEDMVQYNISSYCSCVWCESRESRSRGSLRFPCVTQMVETSSHRVTFRNPSNIKDGDPLRKQSTGLTNLFTVSAEKLHHRPLALFQIWIRLGVM